LLGELLVSRGQLDRAKLSCAVQAAQRVGGLLGEYLIAEGLSSRAAITAALEAQLFEKVVALVNLPDDSLVRFYYGHNLLTGWASDEVFVPDPFHVIYAATRRWTDRRRIRGSLQKIRDLELVLHPDAYVPTFALSQAEREVLDRIQVGGTSLRALHEAQLTNEEEVNSIVYALAITRQFQFRHQQRAPMRPLSFLPDGSRWQVDAWSSLPSSEPSSWSSTFQGLPTIAPPGPPSPSRPAPVSSPSGQPRATPPDVSAGGTDDMRDHEAAKREAADEARLLIARRPPCR
jgi:hypothetical protein